MHILFAEDSRVLAAPVIQILEKEGHCVSHVFDGEAAVAHFTQEIPDLVLMDVEMPNMNGLDATRRIKAIKVNKWVPVMMLTGHSSTEDLIQGLEAGADDYLSKPVNMDVLVARMQAKQRIVDMQNSLFGILDNVHEGILTIDDHGSVQRFNIAAERIFGYSASEVLGKNVKMLMPEPYKANHDGYLHNYLSTQQPKVIGIGRTVEGRRKSGEIFPMHLAVTKVQNPLGVQFIGLVRDITEEEEARRKIEYLALNDSLTGLSNRASFNQQLSASVNLGKPFALLFIDIDGFKPINDSFGHDIGDQVLIAIAERLKSSLSAHDFVARLGGDEFVIILKEVATAEEVISVGQRILQKIGSPMNCNGNDCNVGASIGAALFPLNGQNEEAILNTADNAMYESKRNGKNRVTMAP